MLPLPPPVLAYLDAARLGDLPAMLGRMADNIHLTRIEGGCLRVEARGRHAVGERLAEDLKRRPRCQIEVRAATTVEQATLVEITLIELPDTGPCRRRPGALSFRLSGDVIARLVEEV